MTLMYGGTLYFLLVLIVFAVVFIFTSKTSILHEPPKYLLEKKISDWIKRNIKKQLRSFCRVLKTILLNGINLLKHIIRFVLAFGNAVTNAWTGVKHKISRGLSVLEKALAPKRAELKRSIFLILFALMVYMLFFSILPGNERLFFVSAANDNATYLCTNGTSCEFSGDCDLSAYGNTGLCVDCTYWAVDSSGDCTGDPDCATTSCCGDDTGEYYYYFDQDYTDSCNDITDEDCVGLDDNLVDDACCDEPSDCVFSGSCYTNNSGTADIDSDSVVGEYCKNSKWRDCDNSQAACAASYCSSRPWLIGGESSTFGEYDTGSETECCGDDSGEYNYTSLADEAVMENSFADNSSDVACCNSADSCVANFQCADDQSSAFDADGDGDNDYCDNGEWKDCQSNDDCSGVNICQLASNDCTPPDGYILIRNLGTTGIEQTNQEYTSTRTVFLELNFTENATACRYSNYNSTSELPANGYYGWTTWESCVLSRIWQLTEEMGLKIVYYNINYSDTRGSTYFNDTIYFNYTGAGLDTTPPTPPVFHETPFTNDNDSISFSWYNSSDPESVILNIALAYSYTCYLESGDILDMGITTGTNATCTNSSGFNLPHNTTVFINLSAVNSAGLSAEATKHPYNITIDLDLPTISVSGTFKNISDSNSDYNIIESFWLYGRSLTFNWSGNDNTSSIAAYSYSLSQSGTDPDNVPEGTIGSFQSEISKTYSNLQSGQYYFKVKAKDAAGNWGSPDTMTVWIDSSPPSRPEILSETRNSGNVTYTWSQSSDPESDVLKYNITLLDSGGLPYNSTILEGKQNTSHTFSDIPTGSYNATVGAMNGVGNWRWSDEEEVQTDFDPPVISASPNVTVVSTTPLLKAWTDEPAVCYYNTTSGDREFTYSNTTYHESKVIHSNGESVSYEISCIDMSGNEASTTISFDIDLSLTPSSVSGISSFATYENLLSTFTVNIVNSTTDLASITSDRFKLYIDDEEQEVSIFGLGTGYYNITFTAPDGPGTYNLKLDIDSINFIDSSITNNKMALYILYEDTSISSSPQSSRHIAYYDTSSSRRIGFATNADVNLISTQEAGMLNISNVKADDSLYIFSSKQGNINDRDRMLAKSEFITKINPSFGYSISENYIVNFILRYDNYVLRSEVGSTLSKGSHNIHIVRTISDDDITLKFIPPGKQSDRIVLTS